MPPQVLVSVVDDAEHRTARSNGVQILVARTGRREQAAVDTAGVPGCQRVMSCWRYGPALEARQLVFAATNGMAQTVERGSSSSRASFAALMAGLGNAPRRCLVGGEPRHDVTAKVRTPGPAAAVSHLVERVTKAVPSAGPLRVDQDLVSVSDIARRVGRTGSLFGCWKTASAAMAAPVPLGAVGEGTRIWAWSAVVEWLEHALGADLGGHGVPLEAAAVLDAA